MDRPTEGLPTSVANKYLDTNKRAISYVAEQQGGIRTGDQEIYLVSPILIKKLFLS